MSRQLISSEKFPPKPHNCKSANPRSSIERENITDTYRPCAGPATKVPGLVFCAGQTATGEIKQATVRFSSPNLLLHPLTYCTENCSPESQRGA